MAKSRALERLETGVIVTVIAVLVWLYAEGENVVTRQQPMLVKFVPPAGQELAILPQDAIEVVATIRGSTGEMGWLDETLRGGVNIEVGPRANGDSGPQTIVLKDALAMSELRTLGVNILDTDPPTERVRVEQLVTRKLPIVAGPSRVQLTGAPTFTPSEVSVRMPRSLAERYATSKLVAQMSAVDMSVFETNTSVTAPVPLELPVELRSPWTELERQTVQATFAIRKQTETIRLPTVRIRISVDPLLLREYYIEPVSDVVLRDVELTGPRDAIQAIAEGLTPVWAELRPTRAEVESGATSLIPIIVTPPGVTATAPDPVQVTIRRRTP